MKETKRCIVVEYLYQQDQQGDKFTTNVLSNLWRIKNIWNAILSVTVQSFTCSSLYISKKRKIYWPLKRRPPTDLTETRRQGQMPLTMAYLYKSEMSRQMQSVNSLNQSVKLYEWLQLSPFNHWNIWTPGFFEQLCSFQKWVL